MSKEMTTRERKHHPLSPSNWPAWEICPHFQGGVPSAAAKDGTDKHEAYANAIINNDIDDAESGGPSWAALKTIEMSGGSDLHLEDKVDITLEVDGATVKTYGYADCWFLDRDGVLNVVDYKSGCKTDVCYLPQLVGYGVGIAQRLGLCDTERIKYCVLYGADMNKAVWESNVKTGKAEAEFVIARRIYRTEADRATCPQCKWCANRGRCYAVTGALATIDGYSTALATIPDAVLLDRISVIEGILKSEKERIRENAIAHGGFVESGDIRYEMRESAGSRKSVDITAVWRDVVDMGIYLSQDELMAVCDIGKKDFVDLVKDRAKAAGIKVKDVEAAYNAHVERNPPTQKLVRVAK